VYQSDTEIIYPMRVTPHLRNLRGESWRDLIDQVLASPEASIDHLAFSLLIVRMCNCLNCHTNSYRALRGCTTCAKHAVRRYRETDSSLLQCYDQAYHDVSEFMQGAAPIVDEVYESSFGDTQNG
jgi:hypothetical protein